LRFRELSFSVLVSCRAGVADQSGSYLIRAFNSRRRFAFCERAYRTRSAAIGPAGLFGNPSAST
jgi:hypothetical protein